MWINFLGARKEDDYVTLWVMADRTAEHTQYRCKVSALRRIVTAAIAVVVSLVIVFAVLILGVVLQGKKIQNLATANQELTQKNTDLSLMSGSQDLSRHQLEDLSLRVDDMEAKMTSSYQRAGTVIGGLESVLQQWMPEGPIGGGDVILAQTLTDDSLNHMKSSMASSRDLVAKIQTQLEQVQPYEPTIQATESLLQQISRPELKSFLNYDVYSFQFPIPTGAINSGYGPRLHPISGVIKMHTGIDVDSEIGTKIHAAGDGLVVLAGYKSGYGRTIIIDHQNGLKTLYGHCSKLLIKEGQEVSRNDIIAEVGSSGYATGSHLHFEVLIHDQPTDPKPYLRDYSTQLASH